MADEERDKQLQEMERAQLMATLGLTPEEVPAAIERIKQMLLEHPTLLYSPWDWGAGDFETALEGAGHVGNKEIANHLIGLGARTNLFVLTMLGKTALVKSWLELYPQYLTARGPHGLTLLHHAQKGGDQSKELADYLQARGLKEIKMKL